jgi:hypothetical protein
VIELINTLSQRIIETENHRNELMKKPPSEFLKEKLTKEYNIAILNGKIEAYKEVIELLEETQ